MYSLFTEANGGGITRWRKGSDDDDDDDDDNDDDDDDNDGVAEIIIPFHKTGYGC